MVKAGADAPVSEKVPALVERQVEGGGVERVLVIDRAYVDRQVEGIVKNEDLSRYIL
jgi:ATP-dependent protease HslVU (ClpYQ) ATPase subunit